MAQRSEVFTVQYKDNNCKKYAIDVLNAMKGIVAENDGRKGFLERNVSVYFTRNTELENAENILKIFASSVHKVENRSVFKVTFNGNTKRTALTEVRGLPGVRSAGFQRVVTYDDESTFVNPPLTLNVVGDVSPETVLTTLRKYGKAYISS